MLNGVAVANFATAWPKSGKATDESPKQSNAGIKRKLGCLVLCLLCYGQAKQSDSPGGEIKRSNKQKQPADVNTSKQNQKNHFLPNHSTSQQSRKPQPIKLLQPRPQLVPANWSSTIWHSPHTAPGATNCRYSHTHCHTRR